jgi:hypothetical protein
MGKSNLYFLDKVFFFISPCFYCVLFNFVYLFKIINKITRNIKNKVKILLFSAALFIGVAILFFIFLYIKTSSQPASFFNDIDQKLTACRAIPNNSIQKVKETTRLFINIPKDIFPDKDHNLQFKTISGNATAGWISNAGPYGEAFQATSECWSYYYEFDGEGELELRVKSAIPNIPDYTLRFIVSKQ